MERVLIIIPTLNERQNLELLFEKLFKITVQFDILIVDDNSTDGTRKFVRTNPLFQKRIFIIERPKKLGLGTAYITGFKWGLKKKYDYIMEMDGDLSHDPKYISGMLNKLKIYGYDVMIGSRYVYGISVINWPLSRLIISYFANYYAKFVLGLKIKDTTSGFVIYKAAALKELPLRKVFSNGYSFQIEMKYRLQKLNKRLGEYPIIFYERKRGKSKLSRRVVLEAAYMVIFLKILPLFSLVWNKK